MKKPTKPTPKNRLKNKPVVKSWLIKFSINSFNGYDFYCHYYDHEQFPTHAF